MEPERDYLDEAEDGRLRETELVIVGEQILDRARELGQSTEERVRRLAANQETASTSAYASSRG